MIDSYTVLITVSLQDNTTQDVFLHIVWNYPHYSSYKVGMTLKHPVILCLFGHWL